MSDPVNRQIILAKRPEGDIKDSDFSYRESTVPTPAGDEVLVRNLILSLDPAMRGWMTDRKSYMPPVPLDGPMRGATISKVVASNDPDFQPGDLVRALGGWQDYAVVRKEDRLMKVPDGLPIPLTTHLSVLGITGLTAYFGLLEVGLPKEGETVVVSTAAGAVGSIVAQIAKIKGCRVVGLTGSDDKCAWIKDELGCDVAINYKSGNVEEALQAACPKGIDVYFDNVGGEILNACLGLINYEGRVVLCGAIAQYNAIEMPPGPSNYLNLLTRSARMEGFIVTKFLDRAMEAGMQLGQWLMEGKLKYREDIVDGLENAPNAIQRLFDGSNQGKLIVRIADE
jgi:NADPH-dependent curcumin reductase